MLPLTISVVAYQRYKQLACLIHSLQAQTMTDFHLAISHDGPDANMNAMLLKMSQETELSFEYNFSTVRYNDYGHSLREIAINDCKTEYLLLTNDDNYYVPTFVELMMTVIERDHLDMILCDMIHSHDRPGGRPIGSYSAFITEPSMQNIDIGCFIVRAKYAKRVGFRDKGFNGDGIFVEDLISLGLQWGKIDKFLFVHN